MPIFEYRCGKCNTKFEIFHLSKEKQEDIICSNCGSKEARKVLSSFSSVNSNSSDYNAPSCATGNCGFNPHSGCGPGCSH